MSQDGNRNVMISC